MKNLFLKSLILVSFVATTACGGGGSSKDSKPVTTTTLKCVEGQSYKDPNTGKWHYSHTDKRVCEMPKTVKTEGNSNCSANQYAVRIPVCTSGTYSAGNCQFNGSPNYDYHSQNGAYTVTCIDRESQDMGYVWQYNGYLYVNLYVVAQHSSAYQTQIQLTPEQTFWGVVGIIALGALFSK